MKRCKHIKSIRVHLHTCLERERERDIDTRQYLYVYAGSTYRQASDYADLSGTIPTLTTGGHGWTCPSNCMCVLWTLKAPNGGNFDKLSDLLKGF